VTFILDERVLNGLMGNYNSCTVRAIDPGDEQLPRSLADQMLVRTSVYLDYILPGFL